VKFCGEKSLRFVEARSGAKSAGDLAQSGGHLGDVDGYFRQIRSIFAMQNNVDVP